MLKVLCSRITPSTLIATLALVFAMTGGAYAANRFLITSTKQISPKVLKALKGKPGANGANGAIGANGATGPAGPSGAQGPGGPTGPAGPIGLQGPKGETGPKGADGTTGFTETLPAGKTETGVWGFTATHAGPIIQTFSFTIPLKEAPEAVHVVHPEEVVAECPGTAEHPKANPGNLCIYSESLGAPLEGEGKLTPTGFVGVFSSSKEELVFDVGTWAVTA